MDNLLISMLVSAEQSSALQNLFRRAQEDGKCKYAHMHKYVQPCVCTIIPCIDILRIKCSYLIL